MMDLQTDGRLQVTAGASLLDHSRLLRWDVNASQFVTSEREEFEAYWRENVDPAFGRLICWINFSAGAEFFVKGLCLLHGVNIRTADRDVPCYPKQGDNLPEWAADVSKDFRLRDVMRPTIYGEIGKLLPHKDRASAPLTSLCALAQATPEQEQMLIAAYPDQSAAFGS